MIIYFDRFKIPKYIYCDTDFFAQYSNSSLRGQLSTFVYESGSSQTTDQLKQIELDIDQKRVESIRSWRCYNEAERRISYGVNTRPGLGLCRSKYG